MNNRIRSLALIGCALLALVGCGGGGSSASGTTTIQGIATSSSAAVVSATE
jgi:ABC-type glycerol-3-phosphate transport system substrate-binding protein